MSIRCWWHVHTDTADCTGGGSGAGSGIGGFFIFFLLGESDELAAADICGGLGGLEGGQHWHRHPSCGGSALAGFGWRLDGGTGGVFGLLGGMGGCEGGGVEAAMVRGRSYQQAGSGANRGTEYSELPPLLPPLPCDDRDMRSQLGAARAACGWWKCWWKWCGQGVPAGAGTGVAAVMLSMVQAGLNGAPVGVLVLVTVDERDMEGAPSLLMQLAHRSRLDAIPRRSTSGAASDQPESCNIVAC